MNDAYRIAAKLCEALGTDDAPRETDMGTVTSKTGATVGVIVDGDTSATAGVPVLSSARGIRVGDRVTLTKLKGQMMVSAYILDSSRM